MYATQSVRCNYKVKCTPAHQSETYVHYYYSQNNTWAAHPPHAKLDVHGGWLPSSIAAFQLNFLMLASSTIQNVLEKLWIT